MAEDKYFPFPFEPYDIQKELMKNLYIAIEEKKIGIFESPTGTGKSLSLICGALKWLHDFQEKCAKETEELICGTKRYSNTKNLNNQCSTEPDWVQDVTNEIEQKKVAVQLQQKLDKQRKLKSKLDDIRKRKTLGKLQEKRKREGSPDQDTKKENEEEEDSDLVLNDYHSEDENKMDSRNSSSESGQEEDEEEDHVTKIYYCSRTHSQLSQFVHEVKKSPYGSTIKLIALGSRQNFCINDEVKKLKSVAKINEKCLELQKSKKGVGADIQKKKKRKKKQSGCQFNKFQGYKDLRDYALAEVLDIEELVALGKNLEVCPYYGSRFSIPQAQLVVLPYNSILHKSTREAIGVKLKDNILIVDEAHNLMETVNSIHSVEISGSQILSSFDQLTSYFNKYRTRLKAKNLVYINQLLYILTAFKDVIGASKKTIVAEHIRKDVRGGQILPGLDTRLETINDFLFNARIDNVNLFKIRRYCERSLIARKLNGFVDRHLKKENIEIASQFVYVEAFLEALTNADKDGRVLVSKNAISSKSALKFLLLNPAVHFAEIVREARAIIIAGGTMQPVEEIKNVLLYSAGASSDRIVEFSCGHVIPAENLVTIALSRGPSNLELDFTYQNRDGYTMIDELGRLILNLCTIVPGGIVVFFPSYDYEEKIYSRWISTGTIAKFEVKKRVFREPRLSSQVDSMLVSYARTIKWASNPENTTGTSKQTGAMLFSVVGGKMSEGINFSDDLGRCIVMVGLPYPNINSPELKEKMEYLNKTLGPTAGREHYDNICMKAVNQSIGRAIRHKQDFACIVLADHRFARSSVRCKLPKWIQERVTTFERFGPAVGSICKFFGEKRKRTT